MSLDSDVFMPSSLDIISVSTHALFDPPMPFVAVAVDSWSIDGLKVYGRNRVSYVLFTVIIIRSEMNKIT